MKAVYIVLGVVVNAFMLGLGYLICWYRSPLSPPLCLSGLPPDYTRYWESIWQTVRLGGIIGLVMGGIVIILLIIIATKRG